MRPKDDDHDSDADQTISACLQLEQPRSFFLYAGAGSGKTRSLVNAVRTVCRDQGRRLSLTGQKLGVITYTNAACDEIKQRLAFDPRVDVSTIHAFAWSLIAGYDADIRVWLRERLLVEIDDLILAQSKSRGPSKAAADRARSIEGKQQRHNRLESISRFVYSPTGDNRTSDALNHAEVLALAADLLGTKPGLRRLLVTRYPILLIDESQDTSGRLLRALLGVEAQHRDTFCLGLFGDTMQRIYADGLDRLSDAIPPCWARPRKDINHRCPTRVVALLNKIRKDDDHEEQVARSDASDGFVRFFILPEDVPDRAVAEHRIASRMAEITDDEEWASSAGGSKRLALEHLMSARRFGFAGFLAPLYAVPTLRTGVLQGTGPGIGLFTREVLPLLGALRGSDRFAAAAILRRSSPLLERKALQEAGQAQADVLREAKAACDSLLSLVSADDEISARAVLIHVAKTRLFHIPEVLAPFTVADETLLENQPEETGDDGPAGAYGTDAADVLGGWRKALEAPFGEIEKYDSYVRGASAFDTHQGVKGLEFPRVMVILSDEEARGFMFSYDKLFGVRDRSTTDIRNEADGKETAHERTRRLFYVTCSRAKDSLAIVYYTGDPDHALTSVTAQGWFMREEIEVFGHGTGDHGGPRPSITP